MKNRPFSRRVNGVAAEFAALARNRVAANLSTEVATRQNMSSWLSIYDALPNPDPVLRKTSSRIEILNEIKREPHVKACSTSRKAGVIRRLWKLDRRNASATAVETLTRIFDDLDTTTIIREMLDGWGYGYKPLEILWQRNGNLLVPSEVIGKPPEWFAFGNDNELRMRRKNDINTDPVEPYKFLLTRQDATYNNPYGEADYSLSFWPVTFKKGGIKQWAMFLERFGMPHAVGKVPRNADKTERDDLLAQLNALVMDACAVMPDDASVEMLETKWSGSSGALYEDHARYHDGEISKVILGHASAADATPGKLGGNDPAMDVRSDIIDADSMMVMKGFDDLIRMIHDNNPSLGTARPKFVIYDKNDVDTSRADRDFKLMNSGSVIISQQYFERAYDFEPGEITVVAPPKSTATPVGANNHLHPSSGASPAPDPEFAAPAASADAAQRDVDDMLTAITDTAMQGQMETLLKPLFNLVKMSSSYDDLSRGILKLYPKLDATGIERMVETVTFLADLRGASV